MTSRPLGRRDFPQFVAPYFPSWATNLREVGTDDTVPADPGGTPPVPYVAHIAHGVPDAERIILEKFGQVDGSRFGLNTIVLFAELTGTAATVTLYAKQGNAYFLIRTDNVTANTVLTYQNLPPLTYIPVVTGLGGGEALKLHGGGTM